MPNLFFARIPNRFLGGATAVGVNLLIIGGWHYTNLSSPNSLILAEFKPEPTHIRVGLNGGLNLGREFYMKNPLKTDQKQTNEDLERSFR